MPFAEEFFQVAKFVERGRSVELPQTNGNILKGNEWSALEPPVDEVFIFLFVPLAFALQV